MLEHLAEQGATVAVCESTGGYERLVVDHLRKNRIPMHLAQPARVSMASAKNTFPPVCPDSSQRAAYSATNASRLDSLALSNRFLGRLKANPKRCR